MDTILKINTFDSASPGDVDQETLALIRRRERSFGPNTVLFYSKPLNFVRGEGCWLFDQDGEAYLDAGSVAKIGGSQR